MDKIVLDHGTGAKLSGELVSMIADILGEVYIGEMEDSAILDLDNSKIAMTTDSFVVNPVFFGNGNIGKIAVCGTVNDLAVSGATPKYLTLGLIIEVGLPMDELKQILVAIRETAIEANIKIVAGDTKVVNTGEADKIFINTTGIGVFETEPIRMRELKKGDKVILSGYIGNHSIHLLSIREGLGFEQRIQSDCAPLNNMIDKLVKGVGRDSIHSIRDVTRGGLSAVLHEFARLTSYDIVFFEKKLPLLHETIMAADMLGINPIHLANEGCICIFVAPDKEEKVLEILKNEEYGKAATTIGQVMETEDGNVYLVDSNGEKKILEELMGAELPRLC
ncbi:MAG: hydrogenase expression/formation protein HypE [Lachnospiraceae bacterium]|nr:hydrogenase expression/formation protein HypE [Lachnospiraceae bacterium]MDE6185423.1 hydrogenase expression/formation protein HypE [Lachnospiraceae bacterium]